MVSDSLSSSESSSSSSSNIPSMGFSSCRMNLWNASSMVSVSTGLRARVSKDSSGSSVFGRVWARIPNCLAIRLPGGGVGVRRRAGPGEGVLLLGVVIQIPVIGRVGSNLGEVSLERDDFLTSRRAESEGFSRVQVVVLVSAQK